MWLVGYAPAFIMVLPNEPTGETYTRYIVLPTIGSKQPMPGLRTQLNVDMYVDVCVDPPSR